MNVVARRTALVGLIAGAVVSAVSASPAAASPTVCQWGGTPAEPTGVVTVDPGITNTPSAGPLKAHAWGPLAGDDPRCQGTMTFTGIALPGSSCLSATFDGRVEGLPGVTRLSGAGAGPLVHEFLYDSQGNVVGADQPLVKAFDAGDRFSNGLDCNTPEGYRRGPFSSLVELYE